MIKTIDIANYIEGELNDNTLGKKFLVYADAGYMRNAKRCKEYKYYTNCIMETISSTITPIKNISFQTETVQLMCIVDMAETGETIEGLEDRKQSRNLLDVKSILYGLIERLNGTTQTKSFNGTSYAVTISFSAPTDGQTTQIGEVAEALPVYLTMSMIFFENGVNTNDCHVYLDDEDLYFTRCVISKVRTADQSEFANSKGAKSYILLGGKSIDLVVPAVSTAMGREMAGDVLGNETNIAHNIRVVTPLQTKQFIGTFGNTAMNMDAGANVGYNISLVEISENLAKYGSKWAETTTTETSVSITTLKPNTSIYWGDGTDTFVKTAGTTTHTYTDNKQSHTIRKFNAEGWT